MIWVLCGRKPTTPKNMIEQIAISRVRRLPVFLTVCSISEGYRKIAGLG